MVALAWESLGALLNHVRSHQFSTAEVPIGKLVVVSSFISRRPLSGLLKLQSQRWFLVPAGRPSSPQGTCCWDRIDTKGDGLQLWKFSPRSLGYKKIVMTLSISNCIVFMVLSAFYFGSKVYVAFMSLRLTKESIAMVTASMHYRL